MGDTMPMAWRRALCVFAIAVALNSGDADAAPLTPDLAEFTDIQDLGESAAMDIGESEANQVGEMADYKSTKKKYEGLIKKVKAGLKKKRAKAKKAFDKQMKKFHTVFAKLYAPIKSGPKAMLDSPLGADGMSGMSGMASWAYATKVGSYSKMAHRKIARYEMLLQENYYRHFSTAVCKEVLQKKVPAIGDLQWKSKKKKIQGQLKAMKSGLNKKIAFDRADMEHKIASFKVWNQNAEFQVNGGAGYEPDKKKKKIMTGGEAAKLQNGKYGELVHAAHWAFGKQKAHSLAVYDHGVEKLKKRLKKIRVQHDLTLCRTGRKPNSPQLKFQLKMAKKKLGKQLAKMPAKAKKKAKGGEEVGEEVGDEENDLGESGPTNISAGDNTDMIEFHKLIDASGSDETIAERAKMYVDLINSKRMEQHAIQKENMGLD